MIDLEIVGKNLEIKVIDDGVGVLETKSGLGSEIFNEATNGNWKLESNSTRAGSILVLKIPIESKG